MPEAYSIVAIRNAVAEAAEKLFSEGAISKQTDLALALSEMSGLDLFPAAVPWYINIQQNPPIAGFSETLRAAAKDIHAYLVTLRRTIPADTHIAINIDEARLPKPTSDTFLLGQFEGGGR